MMKLKEAGSKSPCNSDRSMHGTSRVPPLHRSCLMVAAHAFAADDVVTKAMKLYEKRHYDEAAGASAAEVRSLEPGKQGTREPCARHDLFQERGAASRALPGGSCGIAGLSEEAVGAQGKRPEPFCRSVHRRCADRVGQGRVPRDLSEKVLLANEELEPRYRAIAQVCLGLGYSPEQRGLQKAARALGERSMPPTPR